MRFSKLSIVFFGFILACGCVPSYTLSQSALAQRAALTREQASAILAAAVKPSEKAGGFCAIDGESVRIVDNKSVTTQGSTIAFDAYFQYDIKYTRQNQIVNGVLQMTTIKTFKERPGRMQFDIAKLGSIRVVETDGHILGYKCPNPKPGFAVILLSHTLNAIINVPNSDIDSVMAALSYFSPNAKLIKG